MAQALNTLRKSSPSLQQGAFMRSPAVLPAGRR
jgi:hypothetical protein